MQFRPLLVFLIAFGFSAVPFAQNRAIEPSETVYLNKKRNARDNAIVSYPSINDDCSRTVTLYSPSNAWGYVSGTNFYEDQEQAQLLTFTGSTQFLVIGAAAYFNTPGIVGDSTITAKVYSMKDNGAPDALLGTSAPVNVSAVTPPSDTSVEFTLFGFPDAPFLTDSNFFVAIDFSALYTSLDTLGLFTTEDGCGDGSNTYQRFVDTNWGSIDTVWILNADLLIEAVVEFGDSVTTSADDFIKHDGLKLYPPTPNPAKDYTVLHYELDQEETVQITIFDLAGRRVRTIDSGLKNAGRHQEELLTNDLAPGNYFYRINTASGSMMSTLVVQR
ncbi:MAG: T9SS type A sorting domain-containing protein [Saprospiraceae bacterium]|nr:T9SS type A sorting domain-containing protein [Saprospiraceae bacterium]